MRHFRNALVFSCLPLMALFGCGDDDAEPIPMEGPEESAVPDTKADAASATQAGKADFSFDLCARKGWYGDGECDWFCAKRDEDCNAPVVGPEPSGQALRLPVVLHHGFDASPTNRWGFFGVKEALEADGHEVFVTSVAPYNGVEVRAEQLAEQLDAILAESGATQVNLLAHSMGGLDCRYLIATLGYGDRVASLTMISSPHQGSPVADLALGLLPEKADNAVNALASAWGRRFSDFAEDSDLRAALAGISEERAPSFNTDNPDDTQVHYQSWAGVSSALGIWNPRDASACEGKSEVHDGFADVMDTTLLPMAAVVGGISLRPNDGMVSVESAKRGDLRGCIPADHLDEVGQVADVGQDPFSGFDHLRFYRNVAFDLAAQGF